MTVTGMMNLLLSHNIAALTACFSVLASQEPGFFSTTNLIGLGIIAVGVLIGGLPEAKKYVIMYLFAEKYTYYMNRCCSNRVSEIKHITDT